MALVWSLTIISAFAGTAAWNLNPINGDWTTAANWTPATVPNGSGDVATFGVSNTTGVTLSGITVDGIVFSSGASAFSITDIYGVLTIGGAGITNNSGVTQNFMASSGTLEFRNSATAGSATLFTTPEYSTTSFFDTASAGSAAFVNSNDSGSREPGSVQFFQNSTAANATFTNPGTDIVGGLGGVISFYDSSTAAQGTFTNGGSVPSGPGITFFYDNASADDATFTNNPGKGNSGYGGEVLFDDYSSAGNATFINEAPTDFAAYGGAVAFYGHSTAGNATFMDSGGGGDQAGKGGFVLLDEADGGDAVFILNGGMVPGAYGSTIGVEGANASLGNSTVILNGGVGGAFGARLMVSSDGKGGNARLQVYGNSVADLQNTLGVIPNSLGSIEGDGHIYLADTQLTVGSNNLSTIFSGRIEDYGYYGEVGGSLIKTGSGTLTLKTGNTYTGGTVVSQGGLTVENTIGSGTGSGPVQVVSGSFGGRGIVAGAVTIGTGGRNPAHLAPGDRGTGVLTIQSTLTFGTHGICHWNFNAQTLKTNEVVAQGVTIDSGATFALIGRGGAPLPVGTSFVVIDNTAATPIAGTFGNLPDGAILNVRGNNFQANYQGGTGNDLTLTVVP